MILVIDNYDSFTWNLVHYLMELGQEVSVVRNDALTARDAMASNAEAFLISPARARQTKRGSASISLRLVPTRGCHCSAYAWGIRRSASISAGAWCAAG